MKQLGRFAYDNRVAVAGAGDSAYPDKQFPGSEEFIEQRCLGRRVIKRFDDAAGIWMVDADRLG